ncbi:RHS repeat domain-containing protein, partial [Pseudomonas amygdali]|uniref:RHS repeat domain-containing protein n=1 Tax=Pseudomonas amygdali TaxID=47877 RepID=UPI000ABE0999
LNTSRFDHVKDNRLKQWANHEYKYDAWGNLIEKVVGIVRWQTFTYDCENRLVKTETMADTQVESTSSYQYDSLGRRVAKQSEIKGQTAHKRFLWQGLRMLREESPGQSSLYIYEPGSYAPLARVDEKEGEVENKVYYFHTDQIGTPLEMTDAEGQIVWQAKYRAWGALEKLVVNEVEQNLRFQGQYFDVETGLHYNTFRYYDPEIGRFITQDPIGLLGGFNLYIYAPNSTGWIDPIGWVKVYRNLRPDELVSDGISAKNPGRGMSPAGHVRNGSSPNFKGSQYVSTTTDMEVINKYKGAGQTTVSFDTDDVVHDSHGNKSIVDISTPDKAASAGLKGPAAHYAAASREILVEGHVPSSKITIC